MTPPTNAPEENLSFEDALEKIRTIVTELEGDGLTLEESIEKYRDGCALIEHTRKLIADAELRITELSSTDEG